MENFFYILAFFLQATTLECNEWYRLFVNRCSDTMTVKETCSFKIIYGVVRLIQFQNLLP
jgi:hypothetical protein